MVKWITLAGKRLMSKILQKINTQKFAYAIIRVNYELRGLLMYTKPAID